MSFSSFCGERVFSLLSLGYFNIMVKFDDFSEKIAVAVGNGNAVGK